MFVPPVCERQPFARLATSRRIHHSVDRTWADDELLALDRIGLGEHGAANAPPQPQPSTAEVRAWARSNGLTVPGGGRLRPEIHQAWREAH